MAEVTLEQFIDHVDEAFHIAGMETPDIITEREQGLLYWTISMFQRDKCFREGIEAFTKLYALLWATEDPEVAYHMLVMLDLCKRKKAQYGTELKP